MNVLVTGAGGFLGRCVVSELLRRGHWVRALLHPNDDVRGLEWAGRVDVLKADLCSSPLLEQAFEGVETLLHLAAVTRGGDDAEFNQTVEGTKRLLDAMLRSRARRIVLSSTFSVYDWGAPFGQLSEDCPLDGDLRDRDAYAVSKSRQEALVRAFAEHEGWDLIILRPGFIWGHGRRWVDGAGMAVGRLLFVIGPSRVVPLTYVENCATCFAAAAEEVRLTQGTFNVTDGEEVTAWRFTRDYVRLVGGVRVPVPYCLGLAAAKLANWLVRPLMRGKRTLPGVLIPRRYVARFRPLRFPNSKVREHLGWQPTWTYCQAVARSARGLTEAEPAGSGAPGRV